jgi:choline dehydrogenase-like flavoprotein
MAASPSEGVVDGQGRVHGIDNLYIAGTSILPTGSASNPSYTALALALRTADHVLNHS